MLLYIIYYILILKISYIINNFNIIIFFHFINNKFYFCREIFIHCFIIHFESFITQFIDVIIMQRHALNEGDWQILDLDNMNEPMKAPWGHTSALWGSFLVRGSAVLRRAMNFKRLSCLSTKVGVVKRGGLSAEHFVCTYNSVSTGYCISVVTWSSKI